MRRTGRHGSGSDRAVPAFSRRRSRMSNESWTYMGVLDDVAAKYPWNFMLDESALKHLLIVEMLHGKRVLLNDGYLVNNALVRNELVARQGLLWELINVGFVGVMSRGGGGYPLDEMPVRMAPHIESFRALVDNG